MHQKESIFEVTTVGLSVNTITQKSIFEVTSVGLSVDTKTQKSIFEVTSVGLSVDTTTKKSNELHERNLVCGLHTKIVDFHQILDTIRLEEIRLSLHPCAYERITQIHKELNG
ncbi:hypothetical protein AVEN_103569-1 [Araneus ventricosus]|uniref:Uncharacterized protein n=1 Tax=Araneus ventricosus TaxID=182803 RepID=A0A4Y2G8Y7_ARAVE|nr:hypothetical protein AVEN_103569-1 [Araneus ventricosus]